MKKPIEKPASPPPSAPAEPAGIACRNCGCRHLPVYYSRRCLGFTLRVRSCRNCGKRVVTRETLL